MRLCRAVVHLCIVHAGFTDIAATESQLISSQQHLLASISPSLVLGVLEDTIHFAPKEDPQMPFPPPPVDTIGTTRLHFLK